MTTYNVTVTTNYDDDTETENTINRLGMSEMHALLQQTIDKPSVSSVVFVVTRNDK